MSITSPPTLPTTEVQTSQDERRSAPHHKRHSIIRVTAFIAVVAGGVLLLYFLSKNSHPVDQPAEQAIAPLQEHASLSPTIAAEPVKSPQPSPITNQPVLLWDFTTPHGDGKEPSVPANIRREINAAVVRRGGSTDKMSIFSVAEGVLTEGGKTQKVYTTWQYGRSVVEHISFFAVYTDDKLTLLPNQYIGTVLRTVRLPDADVDYLVLDSEGGNNGDNLDYVRVVSLRDGEMSKVVADVGITSDSVCLSGAAGAYWVASKVSYRPAGTAMEILPFEQYSQRCVAKDKPTFVKTTRDDAQKVLLALMDAERHKVTAGPVLITIPDPLSGQTNDGQDVKAPAEDTLAHTTTTIENCYENRVLGRLFHFNSTPGTRIKFAADANDDQTFFGVPTYTGGKDNEYLLFVTPPEHEALLRKLAVAEHLGRAFDHDDTPPGVLSGKANFCLQGFAEVLFIVQDAQMNRKLVGEYETNPMDGEWFIRELGGATPPRSSARLPK